MSRGNGRDPVATIDDQQDNRTSDTKDVLRRVVGWVVLAGWVFIAVGVFQILALEIEISAAHTSFRNLMVEYEVHREQQFLDHAVDALRAHGFELVADDIEFIEHEATGTADIELQRTRRIEVFGIPYQREVTFTGEVSTIEL